ncbi:MAG: hypothetical protein AB8G05_10605 [Oligoflexales bacterium]
MEQHKHRNLKQELENVLENLKAKIKNRNEHDNCLSSYSDSNIADARHQALIVSKIKIILAQPIPPKKDPAKYLYPYAFSQVVKHYFAANFWTGTFKDFSQAPASIQMSYLKKPVSLIINKIIFSYAKGSLQTEDIMHILCGKKHNRISNVLKELLKEHIQTLLKEDKRKIGQW